MNDVVALNRNNALPRLGEPVRRGRCGRWNYLRFRITALRAEAAERGVAAGRDAGDNGLAQVSATPRCQMEEGGQRHIMLAERRHDRPAASLEGGNVAAGLPCAW